MADGAVLVRHFRVPGRKAARRALPVDAHPHAPAVDGMLLHLGHVVGDVVDDLEPEAFGALPQHALERLADMVRDDLAVREREVGRGGHSAEIGAPLG